MRSLLLVLCFLLTLQPYVESDHKCGHIPPQRVSELRSFILACRVWDSDAISLWRVLLQLLLVVSGPASVPLLGRLQCHDQYPIKEGSNWATTHPDRAMVLRRRFQSVSLSSSATCRSNLVPCGKCINVITFASTYRLDPKLRTKFKVLFAQSSLVQSLCSLH